jgi:ribosomal protein S18 acetylase RimI-like enzyme
VSATELSLFSDKFEAAGQLLAARHRRHREAEPLLRREFEEPLAARREVEAAWRKEGAIGAVALHGGRLSGYLVGAPESEALWGPNVWVGAAGHAVEEPEIVRDLYANAAQRWAEAGRTAHYVLVPATDRALLDAWYRLGFGQQQAYGIREIRTDPRPNGVREAGPGDLDAVLALVPLISRHQALAPVFSEQAARRVARWQDDLGEVRAEIEDDIAAAEIGTLVAEVEGRIVGFCELMSAELSDEYRGLAGAPHACYLAFAATLPELRGSGVGVALTSGALAWAREAGYRTMVTDWRVTNLLASRFWPRRGFRTTYLRLHRSIS